MQKSSEVMMSQMAVTILDGFVYFLKNGKIEMLEVPKFGSLTLKTQNGEIVASEITERKQYSKK